MNISSIKIFCLFTSGNDAGTTYRVYEVINNIKLVLLKWLGEFSSEYEWKFDNNVYTIFY